MMGGISEKHIPRGGGEGAMRWYKSRDERVREGRHDGKFAQVCTNIYLFGHTFHIGDMHNRGWQSKKGGIYGTKLDLAILDMKIFL